MQSAIIGQPDKQLFDLPSSISCRFIWQFIQFTGSQVAIVPVATGIGEPERGSGSAEEEVQVRLSGTPQVLAQASLHQAKVKLFHLTKRGRGQVDSRLQASFSCVKPARQLIGSAEVRSEGEVTWVGSKSWPHHRNCFFVGWLPG